MSDLTIDYSSSKPDHATAPVDANRKPTKRFVASKVLVTLPAYNEEESLPELLERIGEAFADSGIPYEVVIVNDGSKDATARIIEQYSLQMPIHLVNHEVNKGLGTTIRDGLREAAERADERDIILTMDADNTHPPGLIPRMVQMIHEGCDVVIASRVQYVWGQLHRRERFFVHGRCAAEASQDGLRLW
jgi:dolichol-phosphate mannosyltransferase